MLKLNDAIKCHDGSAFDSADVKWTIDRAFDDTKPSLTKASWGPITKVTAVDRLTVKIDLATPFGAFIPFLADQAVHVLSIAAVVTLAETDGSGLPWSDVEPVWWIASVYLAATFALSIALPLWLDPPSLMRRTLTPRLVLIVASALVLTLAWRGLPMLIPAVGFGLYQGVASRLARKPANATFATEFLSALMMAACLGWWLR